MDKYNKATILVIALGISLLLLMMVRGFFDAILLAAIFAGVLFNVNVYFRQKTKKKGMAAGLTLILFLFIIVFPVSIVIIIIVEQAITLSDGLVPQVEQVVANPDTLIPALSKIPVVGEYLPDPEKLTEIISNAVEAMGNFIVSHLSDISSGTANFLLEFFIFLYCLYFFLVNGEEYLKKLFFILPLKDEDEQSLFSNFTRVTKATLKGTILIGVVQGLMGCIALAIIGVPNALFWGLIMIIASIIPAVGPALVWLPISIYLLVTGETGSAIGLILFGAIFIGNIDNLLRPKLVGKDAGLPDLMILISTLGGLALFGITGLITGPIVAALFISIWGIYERSFKEVLYPVGSEFLAESGISVQSEYKSEEGEIKPETAKEKKNDQPEKTD